MRDEPLRQENFTRNEDLEILLSEMEKLLQPSERLAIKSALKVLDYPLIFIVGPHRSGSTLFLQWLASTGQFAYPTNLLSRFYYAPNIGAKIQQLLTDDKFNFRNEIRDFNQEIDFQSQNGKTKGALAPNEFWYFWRRFLPFNELDYLPDNLLHEQVNIQKLKSELKGLSNVFRKPFVMKALILNYNIPFLNKIFDNCFFIYTRRNPVTNVKSALEAREKQFGSKNTWYSFKTPEYNVLKEINDPVEQTTKQIAFINKAIQKGLSEIPTNKKLVVQYEDFCKKPNLIYDKLVNKLRENGFTIDQNYKGVKNFNVSRRDVRDKDIMKIYNKINGMESL